jgi:transposase
MSYKYIKRDKDFMKKRREYWTKLFNIEDFETQKKHFSYEILTDGKAVSIVLEYDTKPVTTPDIQDYDVVWGLDPGRSNVYTAVSDHGHIVNVSTPEYYFESKYTEKNIKYAKWYKNDVRVNKVFKELPSLKTSSLEGYLNYLDMFFVEVDYLLDLHYKKPFRDVKFKTYVFAQKKLHKMCMALTNGNKHTVVGFGDWSNTDSPILNKPKGPVKRFKECLKRYATVIDIDEFRTSKTCSCCHKELVRTKVYTVLRCDNTLCKRNLVNRDRNAANNILCLLQHHLKEEPRPECFRRKCLL